MSEPRAIDEPRVITALHLLRDLGFTALYDAEENLAADIADILDAWDALTAQLAAAKADGERLDWMMSDHDGIHVEVHHYGESYGGALSATVFTFDGEYSAKTVREALDAARTGAR